MKFWVGLTDFEWYRYLSRLKPDEVNFWQPSAKSRFSILQPGEFFLFKLHSPRNFIIGGGVYYYFSVFPMSMAWDAFSQKNGAVSEEVLRAQIIKYKRKKKASLRISISDASFLPSLSFFPNPNGFPFQNGAVK